MKSIIIFTSYLIENWVYIIWNLPNSISSCVLLTCTIAIDWKRIVMRCFMVHSADLYSFVLIDYVIFIIVIIGVSSVLDIPFVPLRDLWMIGNHETFVFWILLRVCGMSFRSVSSIECFPFHRVIAYSCLFTLSSLHLQCLMVILKVL